MQIFDADIIGLPRRVKRIAQADDASCLHLIGDQRGDATAKRFAADYQSRTTAQRPNNGQIALYQHRCWVGRKAFTLGSLSLHIREFKPRHPMAGIGDTFGEYRHEWRVHRHAGTMR